MPIKTRMLAAAEMLASCAPLSTSSDFDRQAPVPAIIAGMRQACDEMARYHPNPERKLACMRETQNLMPVSGL